MFDIEKSDVENLSRNTRTATGHLANSIKPISTNMIMEYTVLCRSQYQFEEKEMF